MTISKRLKGAERLFKSFEKKCAAWFLVLYMFSFNKSTLYDLNEPEKPIYSYCKDTIMFNDITKGFYYRSFV